MSRSRRTSPAMSNDGASSGAGVAAFGGVPNTDVDRVRAKRTREGTRENSPNPTDGALHARDPSPTPQITFPTKLRISRSRPGSILTSANRTDTRDIVLPRSPQFAPRRRERGQALGQTRAKAHGGSGVESGGAGGGMSSSASGLVLDEVRMYNPAGEDHRTRWVDLHTLYRDVVGHLRPGVRRGERLAKSSNGVVNAIGWSTPESDGSEDGIIRGGQTRNGKEGDAGRRLTVVDKALMVKLWAPDVSENIKTDTAVGPQPYIAVLGNAENIDDIWAVKDEVIGQNVVIRDSRSLGGIGICEGKQKKDKEG
ncbi:hypothetical protein EDB85DRAFT_2276931 [Lactarius pseudohatsudake]|nr:hypothetical protein EDB85DRAFT_2276931 [Lactarius pseudohatsudake]